MDQKPSLGMSIVHLTNLVDLRLIRHHCFFNLSACDEVVLVSPVPGTHLVVLIAHEPAFTVEVHCILQKLNEHLQRR